MSNHSTHSSARRRNGGSHAKLAIQVKLLVLIFLAVPTLASAQVGDLIWEDNFNTLNQDVWTVDQGNGCDQGLCGWGNQELQSYQADNVSIQAVPGEPGNTALVLQARRETVGTESFTSGKVLTSNKLSVQYGMIEFRMRVPDLDMGYWPAVWMLGTSTLPWPNKGEIDMMEMGQRIEHREDWLIRNDDPNDDNATPPAINNFTGSNLIFYADAACVEGNPTCAASTAYQTDNAHVSATPMSNRFVTYRTYWTPDSIRFTVEDNGVEYDMYDAPFQISDDSAAFREPFFLLMNMAVGGNFTNAATPAQVTAPNNGSMYVDYIRVYQYNGHGSVQEGAYATPETGTFGVFTDNTPTTNKLEPGVNSSIFLWDVDTSGEGTIAPLEGDNVIAWSYNSANTWFGGGVITHQARDMSNFEDGVLKFNIQIPANVSFRIGVTDTFTNENWVTFPANETKYGLVRNGAWGEVSIPIADLRGSLVAIQSLQYMFAISSDPADFPNAPFQYAVDDIVYEGGGNPPADTDTDGDGVVDENDNCPNTGAGVEVDAQGCPVVVIVPETKRIQAQDYVAFYDTTAGNITGVYRNDDVDLQSTSDTNGQYNVGWTRIGEWLEYTVELGAGSYDLLTRVATNRASGAAYTVSLNGSVIGSDAVTATGGWQVYETHNLGQVTISQAGTYTVRVDVTGNSFNLNWLQFRLGNQQSTDSDGDGVADSVDQCANTPAGTTVDAAGCPVTLSETYGVGQLNGSTAEFFVNTGAWADVHYIKNGGGQQNHRMVQAGGRNTFEVSGLASGDQLVYWFTYFNPANNQVVDTPTATYTHNDGTTTPTASNLSLNKTATSTASLQGAGRAFDGDPNTRWESNHGANVHWLKVDLGSAKSLSQVTIDWEAANAATYRIQGSNDNSSWTNLALKTGGEFGARTDVINISGRYRWVRLRATERSAGNIWGYSIYQMDVLGSD